MLSAVKMEGHELPEWSGGGYYGDGEVRARGVPTVHAHSRSFVIALLHIVSIYLAVESLASIPGLLLNVKCVICLDALP